MGIAVATRAGANRTNAGTLNQELAATPVELDNLDRALIEELTHDGRAGNRSLAARLKVNEVTIAARLRRLEDAGVMRVVAITDIRLFGHREFAFALIQVAGRPVHAVAADMAKLSESIGVTIGTGRFDIVVGVLGRDRQHLADLFGRVLPKVKGVSAVHGSIALDVLKFDSKWAMFGVDSGSTPEAQVSETVDQMDLSIIALLQQNARRSNRQIAADLGVSEGTVRVRIKRMLADRVFRIQAVSDVVLSGVGAHAYLLVSAAPGKAHDIAKALARREDVAQVTRVLEPVDLIAVLHSSDRATLLNSIYDEIALLPGVRRAEIMDGVGSLKHAYAWTWIV
ncbi:Lrp/AsnC family transcriptional regulator [Mycobacterium sp. CVI_P3]|uniref:Lrp/AsnC family transcriptional regulator n=1 Tax=Mycobacterium pinniadriaticum TaxID=2994102 RepID=A0ABT3SC85_9MYCO|nr:Lrp/AsnC family transcriptional regulator [Mycobacterium pinniadriaticum]MCX2930697.1 Lrp/AsnC family transcriptional regulator [Mycobacterium pinniadriaticum]MCX2937121.1 Lrp/AsnC family transcriptional regulator [Mycobacterium pinniadriaticum]